MDELRGVVAITVTPFGPEGRVDEAAYRAVVSRLAAGGVDAVTANGNTSEFYALTGAECERAVELTVAAAGGTPVIAGVGYDLARAAAMARHAGRAGAVAIMVHQPVHPYQSIDGWLAYHRAIAEAVPDLGVICYLRSPLVTPEALRRLADECPNVIAVKYAVPDVFAFAAAVAAVGERLAFSCGLAESWAPFFWLAGATGFTSGLAAIAPELSTDLLRRLRTGDTEGAMTVWRLVLPLEELRARRGGEHNVSVVKEALAQLGVCAAAVRPPISRLDEADRAEVGRILRSWGVG
jgi:4-hydroxy-tetrahydrodipicolinate synthase